MVHHGHPARQRIAHAVERDARQREQHHRDGARELLPLPEPRAHRRREPEAAGRQQRAGAQRDGKRRLHDPAAARAIAGRLGARHECNRRRIEAEDAELADQIRSRPGEAERAKGGATEEPRDEKDEDASQERREKRDGVEEGAARQRRAGRRVAAGCFLHVADRTRPVRRAIAVRPWPRCTTR